MTRTEYIKERERLERERQAIDDAFIKTMAPVEPKQVVEIGGKLYWLERYRIIGYDLKPTLYLIQNGSRKMNLGVQYVRNWRTMQPHKH